MFTLIDTIVSIMFGQSDPGQASGYNMMYAIASAFTKWTGGQASDGGTYKLVQDIYVILCPIAMTLALCFCVIAILEQVTRYGMENVTLTVILIPILRYAACIIVLKYGLQIIGYTMAASNNLVNKVGDVGELDTAFTSAAAQGIVEMNGILIKLILELTIALLALIAQVAAGIALAYQIITIRIDFLVRTAFMPLAIPSIAQDGAHGPGMRYIKRLLFNMFMMMGILVTIKLTFSVLCTITIDFDSMGYRGVILPLFKSLFVSVGGPFMAVGAVTSFKAALSEIAG